MPEGIRPTDLKTAQAAAGITHSVVSPAAKLSGLRAAIKNDIIPGEYAPVILCFCKAGQPEQSIQSVALSPFSRNMQSQWPTWY